MGNDVSHEFRLEIVKWLNVIRDRQKRGDVLDEEDVKNAIIDPFLGILGWNVNDPSEVKKEARIDGKFADYALKIDGEAKIIIEAKAPNRSLDGSDSRGTYEKQAINYAYNQGISWAILTNGENWRLYNAYWKQKSKLAFEGSIGDFPSNLEKINLLVKDRVREDKLDEYFKGRSMRPHVDEEVTQVLLNARADLTKSVVKLNKDFTPEELREGIQRMLDRLLFMKICEDRDIRQFGQLRSLVNIVERDPPDKTTLTYYLVTTFRHFRDVYDGELFDENTADKLKVDNATLMPIIETLYEYDFSTINVDILGRIYEDYLANVLSKIEEGGLEWITDNRERKEHGQFYTPQYIVDYIIGNVGITKESRVLDPACGSGAFLIKAYDRIKSLYLEEEKKNKENNNNNLLAYMPKEEVTEMNKKILTNNLYGVDLNPEAVEITKINLWLRSIQKDTELNKLDSNIRCGNSLIDDPEVARKRAFKWDEKFPRVLKEGGFDVVIGNPPYIQMQRMHELQKYFEDRYPEIYTGQNDIFYYFILKGLNNLKDKGVLGFITSRYFFESSYARKFRDFILANSFIREIIDFQNIQLFHGVNVLTTIIFLEKREKKGKDNSIKVIRIKSWDKAHDALFEYIRGKKGRKEYSDDYIEVFEIGQHKLTSEPWSLVPTSIDELKEKLMKDSWSLDEICRIGQGIKTGLNDVFIADKEVLNEHHLEKSILRNYVKTRDIKRYSISSRGLYLIRLTKEEDIEKYPYIKKYLTPHKKDLEARYQYQDKVCDWYSLSIPQNIDIFDNAKEKIITPTYSTSNKFAYDGGGDDEHYYTLTDTYVIAPKESTPVNLKYILSLLNSKLIEFYHKNTAKLKRDGYYEYVTEPLSKIPIRKINISNTKEKAKHDELVNLADKMLSLNKELNEISDAKKIISKYGGGAGVKLKKIVMDSEYHNVEMSESSAKAGRIEAELDAEMVLVKVNGNDILKYSEEDELRRQYVKLYLETLDTEELNENGGMIRDRLLNLEIPDYENPQAIEKIVEEAITRRKQIENERRETDDKIDKTVYELYGLTEKEINIVRDSLK